MRRTGGAPASATGFLEKKFRNTTPSDLERAMTFVIVLIHVSALRRVGLHAPHRRGAGERHRFLGKKVPKHDSIRSRSGDALRNSTDTRIRFAPSRSSCAAPAGRRRAPPVSWKKSSETRLHPI